MRDKLSLVICSCDKYSDIWETQFKLLNINWAEKDIYTVLVTDKPTSKRYRDVDIFAAGENLEFSERIKESLSQISTEYVLIILDDYFLTTKIITEKIERLIKIMDDESLDYIRLYSIPKARIGRFKDYNCLYKINTDRNYEVNLYPGLWRKSFINKTFIKPMNAWEYEVSLTKIAKELNSNCVMSNGNELPFLNGIIKGKLFRKANRYIKANNLYDGDRPVLSIIDTMKYKIKLYSSLLLPEKIKRRIKSVLKSYGHRFYSD